LHKRFSSPGQKVSIKDLLQNYFHTPPDTTYKPLGDKHLIIYPKTLEIKNSTFNKIVEAKVHRFLLDVLIKDSFLCMSDYYMSLDAMIPLSFVFDPDMPMDIDSLEFGQLAKTKLLVLDISLVYTNRFLPEVLYRLFEFRKKQELYTWFLYNELQIGNVASRVQGKDGQGLAIWQSIVNQCTKAPITGLRG